MKKKRGHSFTEDDSIYLNQIKTERHADDHVNGRAVRIAIRKREDNADGVTINKRVSQTSGRDYSMGSLTLAFDRKTAHRSFMMRLSV